MKAFSWDDSLCIGIPEFDEEHRLWLETIRRLATAVRRRQGDAVIEETLDTLWEYSQRHFREEERILAEIDYPHLDEQIRQHEYFTTWLKHAREDLAAHNARDLAIDTLELMHWWLVTHVREVDRKYVNFLSA